MYDSGQTFWWTDASVTSSLGALSLCGPVTWTLAITNNPPDPNVFTIDTVSEPKSLQIYSDDITEAGTYMFKVSVKYTNYVSVNDDATFDVTITDNCSNSVTSTASSTVIPTQTFTVNA